MLGEALKSSSRGHLSAMLTEQRCPREEQKTSSGSVFLAIIVLFVFCIFACKATLFFVTSKEKGRKCNGGEEKSAMLGGSIALYILFVFYCTTQRGSPSSPNLLWYLSCTVKSPVDGETQRSEDEISAASPICKLLFHAYSFV